MLPVWFLALFFIFFVVVIVALVVLYYFVFKKDNVKDPTTGPQGPPGNRGEIGFPGVRGAQGFAMIGPQGIAGSQATAASEVGLSTFSFADSDNATFLVFPDQKQFSTRITAIGKCINIEASPIECYVNTANATNFVLRLKVTTEVPTDTSIVAFLGYAQLSSTNNPVQLTSVTRISSTMIALTFHCNTVIWSGSGSLPKCQCYFSISYQT